jgi:hypothetical protein
MLTPERTQRLDGIGFVWDVLSTNWEQGFASLKVYKAEHGDCLVVQGFKHDGFALGQWVSRQRRAKGTLTPERVQRLDDIEFVWSLKKK